MVGKVGKSWYFQGESRDLCLLWDIRSVRFAPSEFTIIVLTGE